jgi:hypothetical protein
MAAERLPAPGHPDKDNCLMCTRQPAYPVCRVCGARIRKEPVTARRADRDAPDTIKQPAALPPLPQGTRDTGNGEW